MKLQKRFNRRVGEKEYSKWVIVLPQEKVEELGWKEGTELELDTNKGVAILKARKI
jgi:bifunctional DNA-binding transcriptional regulator/antitoxin component of YhaV-PrlF toxin-antitoxin module